MAGVKRVVFECDNYECSNYSIEWPDGALGIFLKGSYHFSYGGGPIDLYACSTECIPKAVEYAMNKDSLPWLTEKGLA